MKKGNKIILTAVLFLLVLSSAGKLLYRSHLNKNKPVAIVEQNGEKLREISLKDILASEDWVILKGEEQSVIRIEPGRIRFLEATCPHQQCVKTGWLSRPGETAVCLPYKLSITIIGPAGEGPDALSH